MTRSESTLTRTLSRDGTEIGAWTTGEGPPLVLVHGGPADHTRWRPLLPYLEPHFTVHAMDRRGRGASGEGPSYDIAREYEDVAALIDAVADISGSKVDVYGHSVGSFIAFGAAPLTSNIRRLALYEGWPRTNPQGVPYSEELVERLNVLLERGENEALLETFFREAELFPDEEIKALKSLPSWPGRVAAAHTFLREDRAHFNTALDPEYAAKITVPTLLVTGEDSPESLKADIDVVATALPDARILVLEGQQHVADILVPDVVAGQLIAFFLGQS